MSFNELSEALSIVEDFNLNTRIWIKEQDMHTERLCSKTGWASLIGLLLAVVLGCFLYFLYLNPQKHRPISGDDAAQVTAREGVDISSPLSAYQSATGRIEEVNQRNKARGQELMKEIEAMQQY